MRRVDWPTAFALVFGGLPAFTLILAAACTYPAIVLPLLACGTLLYNTHRRHRRHDAIAARADAQHATLAALLAAPLPDLPTVPLPATALHAAPTRRARVPR